MEAGWSARRVARQLGHSDCVVRRCWDQWIREKSFTRRLGSGCPRQTSRRVDNPIVKMHAYSQLLHRPPFRHWCAALDANPSMPPFGVVPRTRKLDSSGMVPGRL
ncbi:uncharacterized protein TNCV_1181311 [Trichonephila clavipes]|nr:uncharacterized protein TNCV_1181311 [Trichonephila clavipes]